jgi:tRNA (cytosine34-C5)-methyltransferase
MLAVDGKMVFSTCSLNPIEDEAIVHRLLVAAEGALELIDVSDKLPGLKYSRGLSHWTITARDLTPFNTPEDVPEDLKNHLREPIFPPKAEDAEKFHLDRWYHFQTAYSLLLFYSKLLLINKFFVFQSIRVLPHQQNTGGFFVAALKKIRPLPWEAAVKEVIKTEESIDEQGSKSENAAPDSRNGRRSPARKKRKFQGFKEEPYFHFTPTEEIWPSIK